jgi:CRP/FNR family transcriptional regulator, cyclic AMP receptor protein
MDPNRLTRISIFSELDEDERRRLAAFVSEESFAAGQRILREGDFSTELLAIVEGTADIMRGGERLDSVGPGDVVGEVGLLDKAQRNADVISTSPMLVIKVSHWEIRRLSAATRAKIEAIVSARRQSR